MTMKRRWRGSTHRDKEEKEEAISVEARVVVASIDTYLKYSDAVGAAASASRPTFGSHRSSRSPLQNDDDDDDNGNGGGGSSGAPATLRVEIQPRRRPPGAPQRTRRR